MNTQIIIALCEGPHDVAFLNKIFKTVGFKSYEKCKLEDYPFPMNSLLINEATKTNVEGLNIHTVRQSLLPSNALIKDDIHLFLYSIGSDSKVDLRKQFVRSLKSLIVKDGEIKKGRIDKDVSIGVIYFFDSDNHGILFRLDKIKEEIRDVVDNIPDDRFDKNGSFTICENLKLGCFVFTGGDNVNGKLEDILLPIMEKNNENIFNDANAFLDKYHMDERLFPIKLIEVNGKIEEKRSSRNGDKFKYDRGKSLIGAVGQLQQSGGANTVCIGFTDYLNLEKIKINEKCQEILKFLSDFINYN